MLCLDVSHKILRTDTVLDLLYELNQGRNFHDQATKALIGEVVLTRLEGLFVNLLNLNVH